MVRIWVAVLMSLSAAVQAQDPSASDEPPVVVNLELDAEEGPQVADSGVGYIDAAPLGNQLRFRFDAAFQNEQPARSEFFWPIGGARGPGPGAEQRVDYQTVGVFLERQLTGRWSLAAELPMRLLNPNLQDNTGGLADVRIASKHMLGCSSEHVLTFQLAADLPTGDADRGLGTRHVSLEPALLGYFRGGERITWEAELRDWIAVGGTDGVAGNVLRYGLGMNYALTPCDCRPLTAVLETVGWTVLSGETAITTVPLATRFEDATGDTIINLKVGLRYQWNACHSLYAGYGHALTNQSWYDDILRFEWRQTF